MNAKLGLLTSMMVLLTACGGHQQSSSSTASEAAPASTLPVYRVSTEFSNPPYIFYDAGKGMGWEYDLLTAIAEKEGIQLSFTPTSWDSMFEQIEKGETDIIASNISITDARKSKYSFTAPYFESASVAIYTKDGLQIPDWQKLTQYKVAVQSGTSQEESLIKANVKHESAATNWLGIKTVLAGQNDVMIGDKGVMMYYAKQHNMKSTELPSPTKDIIGFIVKKDNPELLNKLNSGLQKIKTDGTYDKLYEKWLGAKAVVVAPTTEAQQ